MAINDIINTLLPTWAVDYVAVYDQAFKQIFKNARAIKAIVKEQAKLMEHPVENGTIITDHRIILPVEIELTMILLPADYQDVYKQIRQYYYNGTLLNIQTRSGVYQNQLIGSMPHEEDPTQYDTITLVIGLKQVQFARAQYGVVPKSPKNSTSVKRGMQQTSTASTEQTAKADTALLSAAKIGGNGVSSTYRSIFG